MAFVVLNVDQVRDIFDYLIYGIYVVFDCESNIVRYTLGRFFTRVINSSLGRKILKMQHSTFKLHW